MDKKLRVAVIGCGRISPMHLDAIKTSEYASLVACCDIKKERAIEAATQYGAEAYTSYEKMLKEVMPDVVHLCLPHYLHSEYAIKAFELGINVLTEKPMDVDYESAEKAVNFAKEKNLMYGVIFQCRYNASAQAVKHAIESGRLGKIISARSILTWARPDEYYSQSDWKGTWDKEGGGVVIDQAIHSIDLTNWCINSKVKHVECSMFNRRHDSGKEVEDTAEGLITYENGVTYAFYCMNNYGCSEPIEIKLLCEKSKVTFGYDEAVIEYDDGSVERAYTTEECTAIVDGKPKYWCNCHSRQIEQFYRACLKLEPLEISGEHALNTHKLITDIYNVGGLRPRIKRT